MKERSALRDNLKKALKERGLTQKAFASMCGLSEGQLSHYLSGYRTPRFDILCRMAEALKAPLDDLVPMGERKEGTQFEELSSLIETKKKTLTPEEKIRLIMLLSEP